MNAKELFRDGKLSDAIKALGEEIRENPLDTQKRIFLFELLCFAGEWERGEKQLDVLAQGGKNAELGALMYRAALNAERERREFFKNKTYVDSSPPNEGLTETPSAPAPEMSATPPGGTYNEKPFREISDADPRIGDRLEVFVAGRYLWVPFAHIASVQMEPPKRLRDLLWAPALIRNGENFKGRDLGEVMIPVLSPFTCTNSDDAVRLGRATVWEESDGVEIPFGQKMLLIDGEEVPLLELRNLQMDATREPAAAG